jgi:DNA-binding winged helix-turn-helix (wHTH) protein/predicted ATPase
MQFGPYRLDGARGQLWRHTQVIKLSPKATAVLWCLVRQAGQVVTKATLLDTVWPETAVSEGVLSVCMRDLRRALGDDPRQPRYIETVHTRGYRFVAPVEPLHTPRPEPGDLPALAADPLALPVAPGLVGREAEMAQVQACLERARRGERQVLFITGEAGIGKTALVEACVTALPAQETPWVGWGQCVDAYGPGTGYLPVLEALGRLCQGLAGNTVRAQLRQWAPAWLAQLPGVLPAAEQARLQQRTRGMTRDRLFCELAEALEALTAAHLLVVVLEDLHWSDPSTVDVLTMLARRREPARLLLLGTYRPVELVLRTHPLKPAKAELHLHGQCTEVALGVLPETAVAAYVAQRFPAPVAETIAPVLYQRTAGHPLFMVHLATYLAQQAERDYPRAVQYLQQAAENATRRHAPHEVITLVTTGLELLATLPETHERVQCEVELLLALGPALRATKGQGSPEVNQTYSRARQLCDHLDAPHHLFPALRGLWNSAHSRAELQTAQALGEQLLTLAQQGHDPTRRIAAHMALGMTVFMRGAVTTAHTHFAQVIALSDAHPHRAAAFLYGEDVGVMGRSRDSWTLWYLGYPDRALARSQAAIALAQQLAHPLSLCFAWGEAAVVHQLRREGPATQAQAAAALHLATAQGFPHWQAYGAIMHGWARAQQGEAKAGIAQLHQGLRARLATGAVLARPYFLSLLVEAHAAAGQPAAGLTVLTEACTLAETSGEGWYVPELYRLKGTLLLQQSPDHQGEAEACFRHAIRVAHSQQAKSLELRAATSLARLWQQHGKHAEAHALLAPLYAWFTEGWDTADLQEARALLEELA